MRKKISFYVLERRARRVAKKLNIPLHAATWALTRAYQKRGIHVQ